jgi:hypothetical protein
MSGFSRRFTPALLSLSAALLLAGCLSAAGRDHDLVRFETIPEGAEAVSSGGEWCLTPCELRLSKERYQRVRIEKEGYEAVDVELSSRLWRSGVAASLGGNLALGAAFAAAGVVFAWLADDPGDELAGIGMAVGGVVVAIGGGAVLDFAGGAHRKLRPNPVRVTLDALDDEPPAAADTISGEMFR